MARKQHHGDRTRSKHGLKKLLASSIMITTLGFSALTADAKAALSTVYHVYMDQTYIGVATDKEVAEAAAQKAVEKASTSMEGYELELGNELTYITEQVFRPSANDEAVEQKVEELAKVKAVSTAISLNDEALVFLKDEEAAKEALKKLKLRFVSDVELQAAEKRQAATEPLPALVKDGLRIMSVKVEEPFETKEVAVEPEKILSPDDAVTFLLKGTLEDKKYSVQEGDVLSTIAAKHEMSSQQLVSLNEGLTENSLLQIGQELNTVVTKPIVHVKVERELYLEEDVPFEVETVEDPTMPKGETKVTQEGKNGISGMTYKIIEKNGQQVSKDVIGEQVIEQPVTKKVVVGTKVIPARGTGTFSWPTNGGYISSHMGQRWGRQHKGIDIARPSNRTIKAADHGIVVSAGWDNGGYGNKIVIDHRNGFRTVYAHLNSISVKPGQLVEKGSAIGVMGSTGNSTGIHLHFELYKNGSLQNPLNYL